LDESDLLIGWGVGSRIVDESVIRIGGVQLSALDKIHQDDRWIHWDLGWAWSISELEVHVWSISGGRISTASRHSIEFQSHPVANLIVV
jgi:hypothetical protein